MKLYPHQKQALKKMEGKRNFCVFADPGTGKTKICIDRIKIIHSKKRTRGALVFAPKGVHRQWAEEQIPQHHPEAEAYYWDSKKLIQTMKNTTSILPLKDVCTYYCFNYDICRSKRGLAVITDAINELDEFMLVMDESHNIKNKRSKRWAFMNSISSLEGCVGRLAVTGTPIAKNLIDEWAQLLVVDPNILKIKYITHFKNQYCIMGGFESKSVVGVRNLEKYKKITEPYVFRINKNQLDLEAKQYQIFNFDMTKNQHLKYRMMAKNLITFLDSGERFEVNQAMTKVQKLQQLSNGFIIDEDRNTHRLFKDVEENPRIIALKEILTATEDDEPIIIWCRYREDVEQVKEALKNELALPYHGGIKDKDKKKYIDMWKLGRVRFLIATPATAGVGLNLQGKCTRAIYYSNSENAIHRWQSEDRIHRIGTKGIVTYVDMVCTASRDRAILRNLRAKKSLSDMRLEDVKREIQESLLFSKM